VVAAREGSETDVFALSLAVADAAVGRLTLEDVRTTLGQV
jgi:hypothetical protein